MQSGDVSGRSANGNPDWILEGDIKGCFDISAINGWSIISLWTRRSSAKVGFLDKQVFYDTISGTPQGGITIK
jgi:RNA-directed DNA polymerase